MEVTELIGDIYDAASNERDWMTVGLRLRESLGAHTSALSFRRANGRLVNAFEQDQPPDNPYVDYYQHIDLLRTTMLKEAHARGAATAVALSSELVDEKAFRRSEFYTDYAAPKGKDFSIVGAMRGHQDTVITFCRDRMPFGSRERDLLGDILPHIQRAMQLRSRLQGAERNARLGESAFEALPSSAVVVDADLNILFANQAARRTLDHRSSPIAIVSSGGRGASGARLSVKSRESAAQLNALVGNAANGGSGGAMRIEVDSYDDRLGQVGVFVSPQPNELGGGDLRPGEPSPVLILISELTRPSAPKASLLSDLFGLSIAEGAVALALLGGQTAETVARERDVSLETVRSQIRTVLRKTDATNLRDLERIGALLTTLSH